MTDANSPNVFEPSSSTADAESIAVDDIQSLTSSIVDNVKRVIVGQDKVIEHVVVTMLARGHVLLEDVPGVGKTMLARSIARSVDCEFKRVQFTPDLMPADITGVNVFNEQSREFEFRPGPVFGNVVLGDEINRAPPKTQSALLEAMEEGQVTVDGQTRALPRPYTVIATQNEVEPDRTYDLPLAEIDRFTKKLRLGYPSPDDEAEMLDRVVGTHPIESLSPVTDTATLIGARRAVAEVAIEAPIREYATGLATYTREHSELGASPRATVSLLRAAQARAAFSGREYVLPDDVKSEAPAVFSHRIRTGDGRRSGEDIVENALSEVPVE